MQCHGYLPVYHSHYDLNVDTSGGSRPMYNGNGTFQSEHCNNYVSTLPVPQVNFGFKELVRRTMVMHEVTFKDQVQELHRLYRRQRELMTEIKSQVLNVNHLQLEVQSSNSSSAILSSSCQDNLHSLPFFSSQNDVHVDKYPVSKVKKIGGKLLDLELPAEVYIDSDEWESIEDAQYARGSTSANLTKSKQSKFIAEADGVASRVQWTNSNFPDINEPPTTIYLEKSSGFPEKGGTPEISERNDDSSFNVAKSEVHISSSDKKLSCSLEKSPLVVQALPSFNNHYSSRNNAKVYHRIEKIVSAKQNGMSSFNSLDGGIVRKSKRCRVIDINLPFDPTTDDEPFKAFIEDALAVHDYKDLGQIDLNIAMTEEVSPTKSSSFDRIALEIDLEAPSSPPVEECPPPKGYSKEGDDTLEECAQIAAEAIVSMSCKSKTLLFSETKDYSWGLERFAELVDSLSTELDNDIGTLRFHEIDDFEAMTLELTEIEAVEISSQTCSMLFHGQTRKGRTRRSKRKDFQGEVLPALASLSRVEVTEDIQIIEGLMEAAGTPWQLRTRRACRMGRKPQGIKKQTPSANVPELKGEFLVSWGRDNRRPRGNRSPVSPALVMSRWLEFGG